MPSTEGINLGSGARMKFTVFPGLNPMSSKSWSSTSTAAREIGPYVRSFSIDRGRSHRLDNFAAGSMNLVLDNNDDRFNPLSTASTYYPNWKPGMKIMVEGIDTNTTTTGHVFTGFLHQSPWTERDQADNTVTVQFHDGLKHLEMATIRDGTTLSSGYTDTLLSTGLTVAGWPTSTNFRDLSTSLHQLQKSTGADTPFMRIIRKAVHAENGMAFIGANGKFIFRNRDYWQNNATAGTTWGDQSTQLPYTNVLFDYDDTQIWNQVVVGRFGSTTRAVFTDTGSVDEYGRRTLSLAALLSGSTAQADALAGGLGRRWAKPEVRVRRIAYRPKSAKTTLWQQAFTREIGDCVRVVRTTRAGTTISKVGFIESVKHRGDVSGNYEVSYELSNSTRLTYWILESSSGLGDLNETTILGWPTNYVYWQLETANYGQLNETARLS